MCNVRNAFTFLPFYFLAVPNRAICHVITLIVLIINIVLLITLLIVRFLDRFHNKFLHWLSVSCKSSLFICFASMTETSSSLTFANIINNEIGCIKKQDFLI